MNTGKKPIPIPNDEIPSAKKLTRVQVAALLNRSPNSVTNYVQRHILVPDDDYMFNTKQVVTASHEYPIHSAYKIHRRKRYVSPATRAKLSKAAKRRWTSNSTNSQIAKVDAFTQFINCDHHWIDYGVLKSGNNPALQIEACLRCGVQRKKQ